MSQPFDRSATCPEPGEVDASRGEFWVAGPFQINFENNLSSFERNRMFINSNGRQFLEISHLSGADSDGDGRGVVAADFRKNGKMDLVVRQAGGGPLRIYENQFPAGNFLEVRLRGTSSNRLGVGAKLTVIIGDRTIYRNQFPENSYRSQAPNTVHFGLGEATTVDELRVEWPSGKSTVLKGISSNQHMEIFEE